MIALGYLTDSAAASILAASGNLAAAPLEAAAKCWCADVLISKNIYAFPGSLDTSASHGCYADSWCFCWLLPGFQSGMLAMSRGRDKPAMPWGLLMVVLGTWSGREVYG